MPENTNFAFVIIQHLSPDHKSLMPELLGKHTSLSIFEAKHNMFVQPNCIYLLPSKKIMTIKGDQLLLEEKKEHQPNFAIDIFF
jgi:two-component system CheB/CheR fusion protein